jgi:hypothetical protein
MPGWLIAWAGIEFAYTMVRNKNILINEIQNIPESQDLAFFIE